MIWTVDELLHFLEWHRCQFAIFNDNPSCEKNIYLLVLGRHGVVAKVYLFNEAFSTAVDRRWIAQCPDNEREWKITQQGRDYLEAQKVARELEIT
jgi:hypothetical protein